MTVLDAFAVLAFPKEEPAAAKVAELLRAEPRPALTALGVADVLDHLVRLVGLDEEEAVLAWMSTSVRMNVITASSTR